jgi:hypothetical protein
MKLKYASNTPVLYVMTDVSRQIHQKHIPIIGQYPMYSNAYFDAILDETNDIKKYTQPSKLKKGTVINEEEWIKSRNKFVDFALMYRLQNDKLFSDVIDFLRLNNYILQYTLPGRNNTITGSLDTYISDHLMLFANFS